ncbi:RNA polymerase sigma-70 factor [Chryseolinea lacunae]|uniref:RNA polymerase sigma-70 factor n=1 Tax=Chryseolinea lacunae TaxID=2801331 RepID=A0ABS1KKC6_9BACT|nr:RNA polymerase sigma-70 factor [Chryseolinea lacunae]MBL0739682.1 RNA polymerase sigma-70 factor [Chryseolinea lacunae]
MDKVVEHVDADLIASIKQGDPKGLELLFRRLYPALCAYARKFLNDPAESEEIVQELFSALWENRQVLDENQSLQSYLFTGVKNRCLNYLKSQKRKTHHAELMRFLYVQQTATDASHSYHALLAKDLEKDFYTALEDLPAECRKIFELSRHEGLKYQEIANKLNISIKTVETQMSRALAKLRLHLREHMALLPLLLLFK